MHLNKNPDSVDECKKQIEVAKRENKTFLRHALHSHLVYLLNQEKNFSQSVILASDLVKELKKVDDKELLVNVLLEESIAFYYLSNLTKSRASLTNARTVANSKYTPPSIQAKLDLHSGVLHADQDFKTAFSYFYEAYEAFNQVENFQMAQKALNYMLLSKIMTGNADEVNNILLGEKTSKYSGPETDAMKALAIATKKRSLKVFNETFAKYGALLLADPVFAKHFSSISDAMLEKEISRLIQPYSCVQIQHLASCVGLNRFEVEKKLSQMILDKKNFWMSSR